MKAVVARDPLSGRQINGVQENADCIPMKRPLGALHIEEKKMQQRQLGSKLCFYTADVMSEERGGLCHLFDKLKH